jgi:tellurite methyltransferase
MKTNLSIQFFDQQFQRQTEQGDYQLNPFELLALPYLSGKVLDLGCGMGNLAIAAARGSCSVLALDASPVAIAQLQNVASKEALPILAQVADLRRYSKEQDFDAVVAIGLLMFFDKETALDSLSALLAMVREGGIAVINVLVEGTTYLDMFDPNAYYLFAQEELNVHFSNWCILHTERHEFPAPGATKKVFHTVIARKPVTPTNKPSSEPIEIK